MPKDSTTRMLSEKEAALLASGADTVDFCADIELRCARDGGSESCDFGDTFEWRRTLRVNVLFVDGGDDDKGDSCVLPSTADDGIEGRCGRMLGRFTGASILF